MGAKERVNSSLIVNYKTENLNIGISYDNRFAGRNRRINASRTNYFLPDDYQINQNRFDNRQELSQNLKLNLDYTFKKSQIISLEVIGNIDGQNNNEDLNSLLLKQNNGFNSNTNRYSDEKVNGKVGEFALDYVKKFKDDSKSLNMNISTSLINDKEGTNITSQSMDSLNVKYGNAALQRTHSYEKGNISVFKLDYGFPLTSRHSIEMGLKGTSRNVTVDYENASNISGVYVPNPKSSSIFSFHEYVQAGYLMINGNLTKEQNPKWKYSAGTRAEWVSNGGNTQNGITSFTNRYLKIFPSASLTYQLMSNQNIKLSYFKRINRPQLGQLNPFTDVTDSLNPHSGNPYLKPEIFHAMELNYNYEGDKASNSSTIFYRYASNTIRQFFELESNGVTRNFPINIGSAITYGIENVYEARLASYYNFNTSFSLFEQYINGSNIASDAVKSALGWNLKIVNNFIPLSNTKIQIIANYNSKLATPQGSRNAQYFIDLGIQKKLGKSSRIGIAVIDIFNTLKSGYVNSVNDFSNNRTSKADTRAFTITYAYSFKSEVKEKQLENQFSKE